MLKYCQKSKTSKQTIPDIFSSTEIILASHAGKTLGRWRSKQLLSSAKKNHLIILSEEPDAWLSFSLELWRGCVFFLFNVMEVDMPCLQYSIGMSVQLLGNKQSTEFAHTCILDGWCAYINFNQMVDSSYRYE